MRFEIVEDCMLCGVCAEECPIGAIQNEENTYVIDQEFCTECGSCSYVCDVGAIVSKSSS